MSCCRRCCIPINSDFEFPIDNNILTINDKLRINLNEDYTDIEKLKEKIICDFQKILTELNKGKNPDINTLLEEISVVELDLDLDKREFIVQYYLNN